MCDNLCLPFQDGDELNIHGHQYRKNLEKMAFQLLPFLVGVFEVQEERYRNMTIRMLAATTVSLPCFLLLILPKTMVQETLLTLIQAVTKSFQNVHPRHQFRVIIQK